MFQNATLQIIVKMADIFREKLLAALKETKNNSKDKIQVNEEELFKVGVLYIIYINKHKHCVFRLNN